MNQDVGYNSQRNNENFNGKFSGFKQCFSTCAWMLLSYYTDKIKADDDKGLASYLDDVEVTVGHPGIAEEIYKAHSPSSFFWEVQAAGITKWLNGEGITGRAVFCEGTKSFFEMKPMLQDGPVILGTWKLAGLPNGHIILVTGYTDTAIICNDPFGDARTNYQDTNGKNVEYSFPFIMPSTVYKQPDKIRCLYFQRTEIA